MRNGLLMIGALLLCVVAGAVRGAEPGPGSARGMEDWVLGDWVAWFERISDAPDKDFDRLGETLRKGDAGRWRNRADEHGVTLLMHAMRTTPDSGLIYSLHPRPDDFTRRDNEGLTALHHGAKNTDDRVVKLLIGMVFAKVGDLAVRDNKGRDVLMHLMLEGRGSVCVRQLFVLETLDVNRLDDDGFSALAYAARDCTDARVITELVEHGADLDAVFTRERSTALHLAARENMAEVAQALIREGAAVDALDAEGLSALMVALVHNMDPLMVPSLLKGGADAGLVNARGATVTHAAAVGARDAETFRQILDAGAPADPGVVGRPGLTPARLYASRGEDPAVWGLLARRGADLNRAGPGEAPMLMVAVERGADAGFVGAMVDAGCEVDGKYEAFGTTALFVAAAGASDPGVVEALLDRGADVRVTSITGETLLERARTNPALAGSAVLERIESMLGG